MKSSAYFRTFIAMAVIVFISFTLLGALSTALSYRRAMSERRTIMTQALAETARYVQTRHLSYGTGLDDFDISMQLTMTARITGLEIILADTDRIVVACSERAFSNLGKPVPDGYMLAIEYADFYRPVIIIPANEKSNPSARQQIAGMQLVANIGGQARTYGYLFVTSDMEVSGREWRGFATAFSLLSVSVMLLTFIISFITSKKQAAPLGAIANAARRFARGEYDVRVKENAERKDEIAQLAKAFNFMAQSMQNNEQLRRDFIANLSHELKTPMTVIAGFAEGLLDGTIPREDEERYLTIISSETRRMSRLVRSMLEISMLGEATPESMLESSFDITEVVRLTLLGLSGRIDGKQLGIEAELPDDPIITRGNSDSITQVVYNLLDNAVKNSLTGGTVKLELWQQEEKVFVAITNNGDTIPPEELPNIFQRFHKVDKSRSLDREGVGLGLYIVKAILDKHNEDIFVTSADGETKFIFSLTAVK